MYKMARTAASFIVALLLSGAMISIVPTYAQPRGDGSEPSQPLLERLGKDDGYSLVIQYSGDLHGSLETCG